MNKEGISFKKMDYRGDNRGEMYNISKEDLSFLGDIKNIHFGTIVKGCIRGNHYHTSHNEIIIINAHDEWEFAYSINNNEEIIIKKFDEKGAVLIKINSDVIHAIKNTGKKDLDILAITNKEYSIQNNDTVFKKII